MKGACATASSQSVLGSQGEILLSKLKTQEKSETAGKIASLISAMYITQVVFLIFFVCLFPSFSQV